MGKKTGSHVLTDDVRKKMKAKHRKVFEVIVPIDEESSAVSSFIMQTVTSAKYKDGDGKEFEYEYPLSAKEAKAIKGMTLVSKEEEFAATFLLKNPDRNVLSAAAKVGKNDPLKSAEIVLKNSLVWGDDKLLKDDDVFFALSEQIEELTAYTQARIKKL